MKFVSYINQNIPIWCVLKGDHACTDGSSYLNKKLIEKPNFMDARENALRLSFLEQTNERKWLYDLLKNGSFALMRIEKEDVENVITVWDKLPLNDLAKQYKKAYFKKQGFKYKTISRTKDSVIDICNRKKDLEYFGPSYLLSSDKNDDYHRTIWMKRKDDKYQIVDGTHRCLATYWKYVLDRKAFPVDWWYAIVFHQ